MKYKEYKFRDAYEFSCIISKLVECDTEFWGYDVNPFIDASLKFNKISLLHIYIYTQLLNYYNREYYKNGDCYERESFLHWQDVAASYDIQVNLKKDMNRFMIGTKKMKKYFKNYSSI